MKRSERARTRHSSCVFRCFDAAFRCVYVSTQAVTLFFCFNSSAGKNKQTKQQKKTQKYSPFHSPVAELVRNARYKSNNK